MKTILDSNRQQDRGAAGLPPSSQIKMIDIWLIFCLGVPFLDVILSTAINTLINCSCRVCDPQEKGVNEMVQSDEKEKADGEETSVERPPGEVMKGAWLDDTVAKVAPQQVAL